MHDPVTAPATALFFCRRHAQGQTFSRMKLGWPARTQSSAPRARSDPPSRSLTMGGGASNLRSDMEELISCTYLLGRTLASMSFPDMYRLQDFHSPSAPALSAPGIRRDKSPL